MADTDVLDGEIPFRPGADRGLVVILQFKTSGHTIIIGERVFPQQLSVVLALPSEPVPDRGVITTVGVDVVVEGVRSPYTAGEKI